MQLLGIRIETIYNFRIRHNLSIRASSFCYLTLGSFNFLTYFEGLPRLSKNCLFKVFCLFVCLFVCFFKSTVIPFNSITDAAVRHV